MILKQRHVKVVLERFYNFTVVTPNKENWTTSVDFADFYKE